VFSNLALQVIPLQPVEVVIKSYPGSRGQTPPTNGKNVKKINRFKKKNKGERGGERI
jgi:hypothetical protein